MNQETFRKAYRSKKDLWIVITFWICALLLLIFSIFSFTVITLVNTPFGVVLGLVILMSALMTVHIIYRTDYTLTKDTLIVRCGVFKTKVPLEKIKEIYPASSIISGAALSTDRLKIKYEPSRFGLYVSPENKEEFLSDLAGLRDDLDFEGGRVVRT